MFFSFYSLFLQQVPSSICVCFQSRVVAFFLSLFITPLFQEQPFCIFSSDTCQGYYFGLPPLVIMVMLFCLYKDMVA